MDHEDEEPEIIEVTVGPSKKVVRWILYPVIVIGFIGWVVPLPFWVRLLGFTVIISLLAYTAWDYWRVRKFIGNQ